MEQTEEIKDIEEETLDLDHPDYVFSPKEHHEWRQRGPFIVCKSCEIEHATFIGINKMMVGLNDKGQPILKARELI